MSSFAVVRVAEAVEKQAGGQRIALRDQGVPLYGEAAERRCGEGALKL